MHALLYNLRTLGLARGVFLLFFVVFFVCLFNTQYIVGVA